MVAFLELPEDVFRHVASFSRCPEVLSLISTNKTLNNGFGCNRSMWESLLARDSRLEGVDTSGLNLQELKRFYVVQAHMHFLDEIRWIPPREQRSFWNTASQRGPGAREGHTSCVLGKGADRKVVIAGGFVDDPNIHILKTPVRDSTSTRRTAGWEWQSILPTTRTQFCYGASWTKLDDQRILQFGGFHGGGYSHECNRLVLLTIDRNVETQELQARWDNVTATNPDRAASPRAYHTATLLADRYLVLIGGMTSNGSIRDEAILDTHTWTWLDVPVDDTGTVPSGRHGHSVVFDERRNRLVLFGGGSGSDLLRSGVDNSEVWELKLGQNEDWRSSIESSLPWRWNLLQPDTHKYFYARMQASLNLNDNEPSPPAQSFFVPLSMAQALSLGRGHNSLLLSPDTVLIGFGSGRPCTNGFLAFDLDVDRFFSFRVEGPLPKPRFTGVAALLPEDGYAVFHGGYYTEEGDAISDLAIVDLASGLNRPFLGMHSNANHRGYRAISDEEAMPRPHRAGLAALFSQMADMEGNDDETRFMIVSDSNGGIRMIRLQGNSDDDEDVEDASDEDYEQMDDDPDE